LQVELCDPCLSALRTRYLSSRALYRSTYLYLYRDVQYYSLLEPLTTLAMRAGWSLMALFICATKLNPGATGTRYTRTKVLAARKTLVIG